jgi:hypothetical protein
MRSFSGIAGAGLVCLAMLARFTAAGEGSGTAKTETAAIDYEEPKLLVGDIFPMGPDPKKVLFKSQRTSTREGATVKAACEYISNDGTVAARDTIVYANSKLVSFASDEFQTGEKGIATLRADPGHPGQRIINFEYTASPGAGTKKSTETERADMETLIDDMIPGFIVTHWNELMKGSPAKFRYIVLSRLETVGFRLIKDSETTRHGKPVVKIKMEPTSFIIAQLVDPLYFIVEKDGQHRILQYLGRTTPVVKNGNKWKELDADTVFEWN